MSRLVENQAKEYLFNLDNTYFAFHDKLPGESGFDIWMEDKHTGARQKIELKATEGSYSKPSDIFQKLYFSARNEVSNFQEGNTKVLRLFLGDEPPKMFLFDRTIFDRGARFEEEYRARIRGKINYDSIKRI